MRGRARSRGRVEGSSAAGGGCWRCSPRISLCLELGDTPRSCRARTVHLALGGTPHSRSAPTGSKGQTLRPATEPTEPDSTSHPRRQPSTPKVERVPCGGPRCCSRHRTLLCPHLGTTPAPPASNTRPGGAWSGHLNPKHQLSDTECTPQPC